MICVFSNTITLALDGIVDSGVGVDIKNVFSKIFTYIFLVEMVFKIISLTPKGYVTDIMNIFDGILVMLSMVEEFLNTGSSVSAFRALKIFRVLRVTWLIRSLAYMRVIIKVISATFSSFISIFLLLMLFNFIYALLGI